MNLKDLSLREDRLAPGHRLCPGCAASIIARMIMLSTDQPIVATCATGCLEVSTTIYPYTAWKIPWMHNAFENSAATLSGIETAYQVMKKKGKIQKDIKFLAFGGDGGTYDIGLQSLSGTLERGHDIVYVCYDNEAYMNCLSLDTHVMTKGGLKKVTDINLGEKIFAFDQKNGNLVLKKCTGIFDNGIKKVHEVNTLHHAIKATANHPFLVVKRQGRGKRTVFEWKTLEKLSVKEEVVVLKKLSESQSCTFGPVSLSKKGDYRVNRIHEISLPEKSSPALMEFLGLYVGDGWIRQKKAETGFALPSNSKGRNRLLELCASLFTIRPSTHDKEYVYLYSVNLAKFIDSLGFGMGARNKLVPDWVFTLPLKEKEAFLTGLLLSDGYAVKNSKSRRYVSASFELLKTLRLLLQTMDYQVGKIHRQTKKRGTLVVYRQLLEDSTYGYIAFSKKRVPNIEKYSSQARQRDFLAENEFFSTERITSISYVKEEPTIDLRVEGEHNFIADGIVVHNTGVQRSSSTPYGAETKTTPSGKASFGKDQFKKDLTAVVAGHHIPYVAQGSPHNYMDLLRKAEKAFATKGPAFINVISPCVPGWGYPSEKSLTMAKLAVDTCFWPLYQIENDVWTLDYDPKDRKLPITEWLKPQARFRHLFKPENAEVIKRIQERLDKDWGKLKKQCGV